MLQNNAYILQFKQIATLTVTLTNNLIFFISGQLLKKKNQTHLRLLAAVTLCLEILPDKSQAAI